MTSVPIWSVLPHITVEESSTYHGNHFLMDLIHQSPLIAVSDTQPTTFRIPPSVPYSAQNAVPRSLLSGSPRQMTTELARKSNDDCCSLVDSQPAKSPNVFEVNMGQLETSTIENPNLSPGNKYLKNMEYLDLPIDQTVNVKNNLNLKVKNDEPTLESPNLKVMQQDETVSNEFPDGETNKSDWDSSKFVEFFCSLCDTDYCTAEMFTSHLEQKEFNCRICMVAFNSHSDLKSHFLSHRGYRCADCKKYFLCKEDLCNHRKGSLTCTSTFECNICNKICSSEQSVRIHKYDAHRNVNNVYNCIVCDNTFTLPFKLNSHLKRYHVAYENIECTLCGMSLLGPEKLKIHKRRHHFKKKLPYPCSNCGKVFYCKDSLTRHNKSHHDIHEIVCEFCGKSCKGSRALSDHIKYNHKDLEKINCNICSKEFQSMKRLRRHENSAHKPKIPVICEICGKTLKSKEQLKTHLQIHSSERQFKCVICNATFKQTVALRNHSRTHSSVCKYNCSNCGKSFKWKQTFDKHRDKCPVTQNS